jgi:ribosomal protein L24, bacterial/organelle
MKLIKGDNVQVMVGKDRGRQVKVDKVDVKAEKVFLAGINQYKKHRKPQAGGQPGEIITVSRALKIANVALVCPKCKQITRVGFRITNNKKVRICRKCEMEI